ncbi:unnamed protein product [Diabrotica balteata]|uniref:Uncharacterized protein n=1 Tax=Diabrotica balteata TaxID=107213 RepID=A0A9N9T771_DIABA|nr:unnamed protein product [Diabrotica balteata]
MPPKRWFYTESNRHFIKTINRLRANHALTPSYMHGIGLSNTTNCTCGKIGDLTHIVLECDLQFNNINELYKELINSKCCFPININLLIFSNNMEILHCIYKHVKISSYNVYHSPQLGKSAGLVDRPNVAFRNSESFSSGPQIPILRLTSENNGEGSYRFAYETDNNILHEEEGHQETFGAEQGNVVHGSYTYQSPEGQTFTVNYIADENGFRATGDHLPVAPPVPEAIQKSLNLNVIAKQSLVDVSRTSNEDHIGANSDHSEAHDLNSIEVGRNDGINVNRQYLGPFKNNNNNNNGYRY